MVKAVAPSSFRTRRRAISALAELRTFSQYTFSPVSSILTVYSFLYSSTRASVSASVTFLKYSMREETG